MRVGCQIIVSAWVIADAAEQGLVLVLAFRIWTTMRNGLIKLVQSVGGLISWMIRPQATLFAEYGSSSPTLVMLALTLILSAHSRQIEASSKIGSSVTRAGSL